MARPKDPNLNFHPCSICKSPYKEEIEELLKEGKMSQLDIARKYVDKFPSIKRANSLAVKMLTHRRHWKAAQNFKVLIPTDDSPHKKVYLKKISLEKFSQRLLNIGGKALEYYERNPNLLGMAGGLKFADIINSQKALMEKKKFKLTEDSMRIALSKMFGGFLKEETRTIEGELVEDDDEPRQVVLRPFPKG